MKYHLQLLAGVVGLTLFLVLGLVVTLDVLETKEVHAMEVTKKKETERIALEKKKEEEHKALLEGSVAYIEEPVILKQLEGKDTFDMEGLEIKILNTKKETVDTGNIDTEYTVVTVKVSNNSTTEKVLSPLAHFLMRDKYGFDNSPSSFKLNGSLDKAVLSKGKSVTVDLYFRGDYGNTQFFYKDFEMTSSVAWSL